MTSLRTLRPRNLIYQVMLVVVILAEILKICQLLKNRLNPKEKNQEIGFCKD